jgi:hypothetical protein
MKNFKFLLITVLFVYGCGGTSKVKDIVHFKMIIVTDKLIGGKLNEDPVKELFYCFESENCKSDVYVPKITLSRIDFDKAITQPVEIDITQRRKAPDALNRVIENALSDIKLNKKFREEGNKDLKVKMKNLNGILSENDGTEVISFNKNPDIKFLRLPNNKLFNNIHSLDSLIKFFDSKLCAGYEDENYKAIEGKEFILLYNIKTGLNDSLYSKDTIKDSQADSIKFFSLLDKADKAFNNQLYDIAENNYKAALMLKPGYVFIIERIKIIEKQKKSPQQRVNKKIDYPNKDFYIGEEINGLKDGAGEYHYATRQLLSPKDIKKRYAEVGDIFVGSWTNGYITSGILYDRLRNFKERVIIGQ